MYLDMREWEKAKEIVRQLVAVGSLPSSSSSSSASSSQSESTEAVPGTTVEQAQDSYEMVDLLRRQAKWCVTPLLFGLPSVFFDLFFFLLLLMASRR